MVAAVTVHVCRGQRLRTSFQSESLFSSGGWIKALWPFHGLELLLKAIRLNNFYIFHVFEVTKCSFMCYWFEGSFKRQTFSSMCHQQTWFGVGVGVNWSIETRVQSCWRLISWKNAPRVRASWSAVWSASLLLFVRSRRVDARPMTGKAVRAERLRVWERKEGTTDSATHWTLQVSQHEGNVELNLSSSSGVYYSVNSESLSCRWTRLLHVGRQLTPDPDGATLHEPVENQDVRVGGENHAGHSERNTTASSAKRR